MGGGPTGSRSTASCRTSSRKPLHQPTGCQARSCQPPRPLQYPGHLLQENINTLFSHRSAKVVFPLGRPPPSTSLSPPREAPSPPPGLPWQRTPQYLPHCHHHPPSSKPAPPSTLSTHSPLPSPSSPPQPSPSTDSPPSSPPIPSSPTPFSSPWPPTATCKQTNLSPH